MRRRPKRKMLLNWLLFSIAVYVSCCVFLAYRYVYPTAYLSERPSELAATMIEGNPAWVSKGLLNDHPSKVIYLLIHGYGGSQGTWKDLSVDLDKAGYDVIIPAMPGHDDCPDKSCGFGIKESKVVVKCAQWAVARANGAFKPRIVALGISMGGSACWLASAQEPAIDAVVSEGSFSRLDLATNGFFNRIFPGAAFVLQPVKWLASRISGVDSSKVRPVDAAAKWKGRPGLVIQGDSDSLMARINATELSESAKVPMWLVPGAGHAEVKRVAYEEYLKRLKAFAN